MDRRQPRDARYPGLPEVPVDAVALPRFIEQVRAHRFDLALQMHGSGSIVNPLVASFGARHTAGFCDDAAAVPRADAALYTRWPTQGHEIVRMLALTDHLGIERQGLSIEFPVDAADRAALAERWPRGRGAAPYASYAPYVCVHAGAQFASRRWPIGRFAAVADALRAGGCDAVLTGGAGEAALADELMRRLQGAAINLVGRTSLGMLGALLEGAQALVCNDTSVSHIAAALGCPSVVVSCGADVARWAPLDSARHRVLWADMACRPCVHASCPIGHGCALAIEPDDVVAALRDLPPRAGRPSVRRLAEKT